MGGWVGRKGGGVEMGLLLLLGGRWVLSVYL